LRSHFAQRGLVIFEWSKEKEIFLSLCLNNKSMAAWKTQRLTAFSGRHLLLEGKSHMDQAHIMFEAFLYSKGNMLLGKVARLPLNAFINKSSPLLPNKYRNIS